MILVTGASGNNGQHLIRELAALGVRPRAMVRTPSKADDLRQLGAEVVAGDFANVASLATAMKGCTDLFLLAPVDQGQANYELDAIAVAKASGVRRIVKLSAVGADPLASGLFSRSHGLVESALRESGLAWVILRPNFFMTNLLGSAGAISNQKQYYGHWGGGRAAWVHPRDTAAVAARVLTSPGHEGRVYSITGPEALSNADVCTVFSRVLGRTISYVDLPDAQFVQALAGAGLPPWQAAAVAALKETVISHEAGRVDDTVFRVVGRPPVTLEQFVRENVRSFGG